MEDPRVVTALDASIELLRACERTIARALELIQCARAELAAGVATSAIAVSGGAPKPARSLPKARDPARSRRRTMRPWR